MSLFAELRRRKVLRMAGLYLLGAWLVVQVAGTLLPIFHTPAWVLPAPVVLLALGFLPAWVFELAPEGVRPCPGSAAPAWSSRGGCARTRSHCLAVAAPRAARICAGK